MRNSQELPSGNNDQELRPYAYMHNYPWGHFPEGAGQDPGYAEEYLAEAPHEITNEIQETKE